MQKSFKVCIVKILYSWRIVFTTRCVPQKKVFVTSSGYHQKVYTPMYIKFYSGDTFLDYVKVVMQEVWLWTLSMVIILEWSIMCTRYKERPQHIHLSNLQLFQTEAYPDSVCFFFVVQYPKF